MERENFSSRLGFILISAGCAIGLGNVWRFPFITGMYGGASFVLIYLFFLLILGLPIMVAEFSVGRASCRSAALSFDILEPKGTKWHLYKYGAIAGNYILMMFYTTVAGWMLYYFYKMAVGDFAGLDAKGVGALFGGLLGDPLTMTFNMGPDSPGLFWCLSFRFTGRCRKNHKNNDVMPAHPHVSLSCKLNVLTRSGSWS